MSENVISNAIKYKVFSAITIHAGDIPAARMAIVEPISNNTVEMAKIKLAEYKGSSSTVYKKYTKNGFVSVNYLTKQRVPSRQCLSVKKVTCGNNKMLELF